MNDKLILSLLAGALYLVSKEMNFPTLFQDTIKADISGNTIGGNTVGSGKGTPDNFKDLYVRFAYYFTNYKNIYNLNLPIEIPLATVQIESGSLYKTKDNKDVIGDNGNSIGYMQVGKYALADVNKSFNKNYSFNDLSLESINLVVGTLYLELCYNSSIKQNSKNPVLLTFKKYNGGIDETDSSNNPMASNYANKAFEYYKNFLQV